MCGTQWDSNVDYPAPRVSTMEAALMLAFRSVRQNLEGFKSVGNGVRFAGVFWAITLRACKGVV
jgi:hypothetical protein